ncbi:MAG: type I-B CRISPR-associated endonuclease Cas1 [Thermosipho sp. (in: Bacteria)]|nr:type I-B CRISPR-associated endonuclease Cas1 [Thermosipho sp. (in: thermotogales)]
MKESVYIFSNGMLKRQDNTLLFIDSNNKKKYIPVENLKEILVFGEVDFNKRVLELLSQKEIILSLFNYYGFYVGSYYPREHYNSGYMILKQAEHYLDINKRILIAKNFVEGAVKNSVKNLKYYKRREKDLDSEISEIMTKLKKLNDVSNISKLMQIEGEIKKTYYKSFNKIIENESFKFEKRNKRPPIDRINALISFSNSIIYNAVLREIYSTHLDPRIGFLHYTNFRRFSLNLDIAEIFKPVIGDKVIFKVINKGIIKERDFEKDLNRIFLNNSGKRKFIEEIEKRMGETIKLKKFKNKVSYRILIRMELYKLEKHLLGEDIYKPFVMEW